MKKSWLVMRALLPALCLVMGMGLATGFAATMAEVEKEAKRGGYRLVTSEELWGMVSRDPAGVLLVDTRQQWEYAAGHLAGAVNFPMEPTWLARLGKRGALAQLLGPDKDKTIVFY